MLLLLITYRDQAGSLARGFQRFGHDGGHNLAAIANFIGLEHRQILIVLRTKARRVLVPEHGQDARHRQGGARVDRHNPAPRDSALHESHAGDSRDRVLVRVFGGAGHFQRAVDPVQRSAHRGGNSGGVLCNGGHGRASSGASSKSSRVRTIRLRASGTLNALPASG